MIFLSAHGIESFDAAATEVFDSKGRILRPVVDGFGVQYETDPTKTPDPGHLANLLRGYFRRMKKTTHISYRTKAESCRTLDELVALLVRWSNQH